MIADPSGAAQTCRLCEARATYYGQQVVLGKYPVSYFQCEVCQSLQTELPYWLEEAYSSTGTELDVGACQRCVDLALDVSAVLAVLGFGNTDRCLDYGAGMGLFSRFMRDRGFNFYAYDKYRTPAYMDRFSCSPGDGPWSLVSAFEVFEHLPNPRSELAEIFRSADDMVLCSTEFWTGQGLDWWYLVPDSGQHVFFYSPASFQLLAREHGFTFFDGGLLKIFLRPAFIERCGRSEREIAAILHDKKKWSNLKMKLFQEHQRDPYRWIVKDFCRLVQGSPAEGMVVGSGDEENPTPLPVWRRIVRRLKRVAYR